MSAPTTEIREVKHSELTTFTRQLGAMLDVGVDVLRALRIAAHQSGNKSLTTVATELCHGLEDGRELHEAMAREPALFSPLYIEMVRQGEADGTLGKALLAVADYMDRTDDEGHEAVPPAESFGGASVARVMITLGVQAVGAAILWALNTSAPAVMPDRWLGPVVVLWCGAVLVAGAWYLRLPRRPSESESAASIPGAPRKSTERKVEEAAGVARVALMEQEEEHEAKLLSEGAGATPFSPRASGSSVNGDARGTQPTSPPAESFSLSDPEEPPKFD